MCGICSSRCPARISHPQVALLARRLTGKYIIPPAAHLEKRVHEIEDGDFTQLVESLMQKPIEELKELYNHREIEK
jgi:heterodisulfide reductase subunit C